MRLRALLGFALAALAMTACATRVNHAPLDHLPALAGDYFPLDAESTRRRYHIYVRLPEGYDPAGAQRYPVVYLLDGDSLFPLLSPTHLFLHYDEGLPEAIVVGIAYGSFDPAINKRDVDFSDQGAARFLAFLKYQLIPGIEHRYRADASRRVLLGQSRAGYFVLWSAIEDPALFWGRIASNASFEPHEALRRPVPAAAKSRTHLAVVSGTRDSRPTRMHEAIDWIGYWKSQPDTPWDIRHFPLEGGTHAASIGQAYRDAMVWLFEEAPGP